MCKDQDPVLGSMLPHPGILDLLISTKIHFNFDELWVQKRKDLFFFFFGLRVHICSFEILLHFHSSCWWVSADLYYQVIMGSRDCVSLKVMACDCLLHYFQWDSVIAILRDSIPLKVIVWDCPRCYRALNWIEFILNGRGQPQNLTFKRCGLDKVFGQPLGSLTACMENIFLLFKHSFLNVEVF